MFCVGDVLPECLVGILLERLQVEIDGVQADARGVGGSNNVRLVDFEQTEVVSNALLAEAVSGCCRNSSWIDSPWVRLFGRGFEVACQLFAWWDL